MAGRIPQTFIDDLIDRTDIAELVNSRVALKKSGKNYSACCPFHDEKTPSFTVSPQKQFYYCFGCGAAGNVIGFLMEHDHMDFRTAIETLAKAAGMEVPREESNPREEAAQRRRLDIYSELEKASIFYRFNLKSHQPAVDYLKSRGLTGQIAREFALGYAPDEWDSLIKICGDDQQALKLMLDGGMLIERDQDSASKDPTRKHYDRFRDRIMFPIRDQRGRTIAFGGRVLGDQKPKYLNSPETPVFHKSRELYGLYEVLQQRQKPEELIVVEGYMDVVALAQFGVRNAVATLGTSIGPAHMERIFRQVSKVVFCFDGDNAGRAAAQRALDACLSAILDGRQAQFLFLPEGEDPDSIVRAEGAEGFAKRVKQSKTLSDFMFELAGADLDLSKPDQRAIFAHKALPYLNRLPKGLLQSVLLQRLAEATGIEKQELLHIASTEKAAQKAIGRPVEKPTDWAAPEFEGAVDYQAGDPEQAHVPNTQKTEQHPLSSHFKRLLKLIILHPKLALSERFTDDVLHCEDPQKLVTEIRDLVEKNPHTELVHLHGYFMGRNPAKARQLSQLIGASSITAGLEPAQVEAEFNETFDRLIRRLDEAEIKRRMGQIAAVPYEQMTEELRAERRQLHNKLSRLKAH